MSEWERGRGIEYWQCQIIDKSQRYFLLLFSFIYLSINVERLLDVVAAMIVLVSVAADVDDALIESPFLDTLAYELISTVDALP